MTATELRAEIFVSVARFHPSVFPDRAFTPGETPAPCAGRAFDSDELVHVVDSSLDFWLTTGRYAARFEHEFTRLVGVRHAMLCNSGSSPNLLAVAALTASVGERPLRKGDEVITVASAFPTTAFSRRISGELTNTDAVMNRTLWVGVYPGLTVPMMEWIAESSHQFAGRRSRVSTMAAL